MTQCIAFDVTRLFIGVMSATPRGIDRVDIGYARHFLEQWAGDCVGVLPTPWGLRWFNRDRSLRVVNFVEDFWREAEDPDTNQAYRWVKARLTGEPASPPTKKSTSAAAGLVGGLARFARHHGLALGQPIKSLPRGTVYLNTGQTTLAIPQFMRWLSARKDVTPVFMLHDAIPIEYPEYCLPRSSRLHAQMIACAGRYAAGLILTSEAAAASIRQALSQFHRSDLAMVIAALPVPTAFLEAPAPDPNLRGTPYFVITGAIEPRKNHLLLLSLWRQLVSEYGAASPKLVLVGTRTRTSDAVISMLDRCNHLRDHVIEIAGLPTPSLRRLLANARALLMPSFAEGFGLPIIEALALGTPVIASDLPSHREAGGPHATYVSPVDGLGWLEAIRGHASGSAAGSAASRRAGPYRPHTWSDYFRRIEPFIASASRHSRN